RRHDRCVQERLAYGLERLLELRVLRGHGVRVQDQEIREFELSPELGLDGPPNLIRLRPGHFEPTLREASVQLAEQRAHREEYQHPDRQHHPPAADRERPQPIEGRMASPARDPEPCVWRHFIPPPWLTATQATAPPGSRRPPSFRVPAPTRCEASPPQPRDGRSCS